MDRATRLSRAARGLPFLLAALALALPASAASRAFTGPAAAHDQGQPPVSPAAAPTVDPRVAQVARAAQARHGDKGKVHVIVYGPGADEALAALHGTKVTPLSLIDAVSGVIKASQVGTLGLSPGVTYVNVDSPVKHTGAGSTSATAGLATL